MPAAIENYIFFLNITIKNCITILASIYLLFVYPFLLITSKINITNRYMSPLQFDMSMGRIKIISNYMCSHKKTLIKCHQNGCHSITFTLKKYIFCMHQPFKMHYFSKKNELVVLNHFPVTGGNIYLQDRRTDTKCRQSTIL